jgi:hypothetical protein
MLPQGVRGFDLRRCRYIGLAKARLQHVTTAGAINVYHLAALFVEEPEDMAFRGRIDDRHRPGRGGIRRELSGMRVTSASLSALK